MADNTTSIRGRVQQAVFDEAAAKDMTIKQYLSALVAKGETLESIAERYGSTKQTISAMIRRHGLKPRGSKAEASMTEHAQELGYEDLDDYLIRTWMDKTVKQQSEDLGVSVPTVARYRAKLRKKRGI